MSATGALGRRCAAAARLPLGAIYIFNGALPWTHLVVLPMPNPRAGAILTALYDTGIVMQVVKSLEVVSGVLLVTNSFVPLALLMLLPISVFIGIVDLVLDPYPLSITLGGYLLAANVGLMFAYLSYYRSVLTCRALI
jgi:hypothetical protein